MGKKFVKMRLNDVMAPRCSVLSEHEHKTDMTKIKLNSLSKKCNFLCAIEECCCLQQVSEPKQNVPESKIQNLI